MTRTNMTRIVYFTAFMIAALNLGAPLAHAFELVNKMALDGDAYFTVQQIYSGWNRVAWLLLAYFVVLGLLIWRCRDDPQQRRMLIAAFAMVLVSQAIFWIWTFPTNRATENWTVQPETWAALRRQWEYSHAAGALFHLAALAFLTLAALSRRGGP